MSEYDFAPGEAIEKRAQSGHKQGKIWREGIAKSGIVLLAAERGTGN